MTKTKKNFSHFLIALVFLFVQNSFLLQSQISAPYNLDFEEGDEGSPVYGWMLGDYAKKSGFTATISTNNPFKGEGCASIKNNDKVIDKDGNVASFYQKIDATFYLKKRVRFSAMVKISESNSTILSGSENISSDLKLLTVNKLPYLFLNSRNRRGDILASGRSSEITQIGWNKYFVEADIPAGVSEITFGITISDTTDVYLDDCYFEIISDDSLHYEPPKPLSLLELMYLLPFANISGGVQYFHPSKVASEINWNDVILAGIEQCKNIENLISSKKIANKDYAFDKIIIDSLHSFFSQLAPQIIISTQPNSKEFPKEQHKYLFAWQHTGVPTNVNPKYLTNSKIVDLNGTLMTQEGVAVQYVQLKEFQNKELLLNVFVKLNKFYKGTRASISVRFENEMGEYISFLKKDSIVSENWEKHSLHGQVPENATRGLIILALNGYGQAFFDDVQALIKEDNDKDFANFLPVQNSGFEYLLNFDNNNWMTTNETFAAGYKLDYSSVEKYTGKQSLIIHTDVLATPKFPNENYVYSNPINNILQNQNFLNIFDNSKFDNSKNSNIKNIKSKGYFVSFPLFVPAEFFEIPDISNEQKKIIDYQTYPISSGFKQSTGKNAGFTLSWKDRNSRLAMVIKIFNLLNHFSLSDIAKNKLDSAFIMTLKDVAICNDKIEFKNIIQNFLDITNDYYAKIWFDGDVSKSYSLPFLLELIDNRIYISNVAPNYRDIYGTKNILQIGDELIEIEGKKIDEYFNGILKSNIAKWQKNKQLLLFRCGEYNTNSTVKIKNRNGDLVELKFNRTTKSETMSSKSEPYQVINDSILYLDLTIFNDKIIDTYIDTISQYKKMIFDLRGDVQVSEYFLSLMYDSIIYTSQSCVPYFTEPEKKTMSFYKVVAGIYPSEKKRLTGEFVFLVDWRTYGYSEGFASTVKEYGIGKLIGEETQGSLITGVPIRLDNDFTFSLGTKYGYTPTGESFFNSPIQPDLKIKFNHKELDNDQILQAAIKYLQR